MRRILQPTMELIIVDHRPGDYQAIVELAEHDNWSLRFASDGQQALRLLHCQADWWLISSRVGGIPAQTLAELIWARRSDARIGIVSESYSQPEEIVWRQSGAAFYWAKPLGLGACRLIGDVSTSRSSVHPSFHVRGLRRSQQIATRCYAQRSH